MITSLILVPKFQNCKILINSQSWF